MAVTTNKGVKMKSMMVKIGDNNKFTYLGAEYDAPVGYAGQSIQAHDLGDYILLMIGAGRAYHKQKPAPVVEPVVKQEEEKTLHRIYIENSSDVKPPAAPKKRGRPKAKKVDKSE